jgi:MarR family transcriptional regulator, organic hydroperoxide resistance regulator
MTSNIQDEIKQNKPFRSVASEAHVALLRTADLVAREIAEVLKPYGVSPTQYNVLRILRGAGPGGLACGEIGGRMITQDPDITRLLDRMEKAGWIERTRDSRDRRVVTTRLTKQGKKVIEELEEPLARFERRRLKKVGEKRLRELVELLDVMRGSSA